MKNVKKRIGLIDKKKFEKIRSLYDLLASDVAVCNEQLKELFPGFTLMDLSEFLNSKNPKEWLIKKYAEVMKDNFPQMNVYQLISQGLLNLPAEFDFSIEDIEKRINPLITQISETAFFYPVINLLDPDKGINLDGDFTDKLTDFLSVYCETPEQERVVEILEDVQSGLNKLAEQNVFNLKHGPSELSILGDIFEIDGENGTHKLKLWNHVFYHRRFKQFGKTSRIEIKTQSELFSYSE